MVAGLFFTYAVIAVFLTVNALRRPAPPTTRFPPLWLPAMLTAELAPLWLAVRTALAVGFVAAGGLDSPVGRGGLALLALTVPGLATLAFLAVREGRRLDGLAGGGPPRHRPDLLELVSGWPRRVPADLEVAGPFEYAPALTLDLYRGVGHSGPAPCLVYLHGGSWTGGDPHSQARPFFHELALRGWVVATIRYPLSPAATFPDHLIGAKQAIAWLRREGPRHGVDPTRIAIAGGSAGAHLASLVALTAGRADFQPGFEAADTSVAACLPFYGVFDFVNRHRTRHSWPVIPHLVMKARPREDPARYRDASPIDQVGPQAPPFLVVHGTHDSLVPPGEARHFVAALEEAGAPVAHVEVRGAQHAFDAVSSVRSRAVARLAAAFLQGAIASARTG
jgi:acetyl esterase/lipase